MVPSEAERVPHCRYVWADVNNRWARSRHLPAVLMEADEVLQKGGVVVVHCYQGTHRTGAFCAWLWALVWGIAGCRQGFMTARVCLPMHSIGGRLTRIDTLSRRAAIKPSSEHCARPTRESRCCSIPRFRRCGVASPMVWTTLATAAGYDRAIINAPIDFWMNGLPTFLMPVVCPSSAGDC